MMNKGLPKWINRATEVCECLHRTYSEIWQWYILFFILWIMRHGPNKKHEFIYIFIVDVHNLFESILSIFIIIPKRFKSSLNSKFSIIYSMIFRMNIINIFIAYTLCKEYYQKLLQRFAYLSNIAGGNYFIIQIKNIVFTLVFRAFLLSWYINHH